MDNSLPRPGDVVTLRGRITEIRDGEAYVEIDGSTGCHDGNVWLPVDAVQLAPA